MSDAPPGVRLRFETAMWPLVLITMPSETTDRDVDFLQSAYEHVFAAPTQHALVVDTSGITKVPGAAMRRRMKDFEDSRRAIIARQNIGSAIVLPSGVLRGAYTALRWISPQPSPNRAFSNLQDAVRWCIQEIERNALHAPEAAYRLAGLQGRASRFR